MLYNFNKIDNSGKLSLFRKGTSNSIGLTDVKLPAANVPTVGLGDMKMAQGNASNMVWTHNIPSAGDAVDTPVRFTGKLTLNKQTIANLNPDITNDIVAQQISTFPPYCPCPIGGPRPSHVHVCTTTTSKHLCCIPYPFQEA